MTEISPKLVMDLRAATGLPMMQCKQALQSAGGDIEKAIDLLRKSGMKAAASKAGRAMAEGIVRVQAEPGGKRTTLLLVRCETEPVRNTPDFKGFADKVLAIAHATKPADVAALILFAGAAGVDMAGHAFTHENGELSVPALEDGGHLRARIRIRLRAARHQERSQAAFDGLA